ncbi:MAG: hypothetical protein ABWZ16_13195 [Microbacterium sp.]
MITLYTVTLTVACCVAVALVVVSERRSHTADAQWVTTSTLAVLAASSATLSSLAYAMSGAEGENLMPLVIGDVSMPLSIGLILAAVRRAAGRRRTLMILSVTLSLAVGATTLLLSPDAGQAVKLLVLAVLSGLTAMSCLRSSIPPLGAWLVGLTMATYGLYCVLRFGLPLVIGTDHRYVRFAFERGPSTIAAAIAVALVAWGMIVIIRRSHAPEQAAIVSNATLTNWIDALLSQRDVVLAVTISVPALPLHRAAFGRAWAQAIDNAVTQAAGEVMPAGSVIGRVAPGVLVALQFATTFDLTVIRGLLHESYERMLPSSAPTDPPDLEVQQLRITSVADVRRFTRHARATARRAMASQGV